MKVEIGSQLTIREPTQEVVRWIRAELEIVNPEYAKKKRMGFYVGNIPKVLYLYEVIDKNVIVVPFGCLRSLIELMQDAECESLFVPHQLIDYKFINDNGEETDAKVPLYEYQETAVNKMIINHYGILQSPAGSGKTQMGIAIAVKMRKKCLWLTHTKDLLTQSLQRAAQYIDITSLGVITEGKVEIGECITFATIQTMCNLNLELYKNMWDVIIVDECHRVAGTPTAVTRFSKVLNILAARHKYGLSATVHRADGMIKATYALLGQVVYTVPDEAVAEKIMQVTVQPLFTGVGLSTDFLNSDGTISYYKMIDYLIGNTNRNYYIQGGLRKAYKHYNLILSERVSHLNTLYNLLPKPLQETAAVIDGKTKKEVREQALNDMREGKLHYLFATYPLAKEGLDIPRLDRLFLVTPQKDYAVIVQSVGRIARTFPGKKSPMVYDYVDNIRSLEKSYKKRCTHYRKCGCRFIGENNEE